MESEEMELINLFFRAAMEKRDIENIPMDLVGGEEGEGEMYGG